MSCFYTESKESPNANFVPPATMKKSDCMMRPRLKFKNHQNHLDIICEIYNLNKYYLTEQAKDSLIDAIDCMKYVISVQGDYPEIPDCSESVLDLSEEGIEEDEMLQAP